MTVVLAICVAVVFTVSVFMILGQELKGIAIGVFLLGHAANLAILAMSGSPVADPNGAEPKRPPLLSEGAAHMEQPLEVLVDPLPQALILTAIVISFGMMGFLLSLMVVTARRTKTLNVTDLAQEQQPTPSESH
ncbi:MAG: sodium:proton antiporter [Phycisphaeraceae bacterium]